MKHGGGDLMDAKVTGGRIAKRRREMGLSQKELAGMIGVTDKAISRWETGRGYPDIEILPKLAETLGISVQVLLGEEPPEADAVVSAKQELETVCHYAGQQSRRQKNTTAVLCVVVAVLLCVRCWPRAVGFYNSIVGSDACVIASDYSSLTYYGEKYLPLPTSGYECAVGEQIVAEAQVEGSGFFGKLLFEETLYEVKNVRDYELVYLQTEYDSIISNCYVLEAAYEKYMNILENGTYDQFYAVLWQDDMYGREFAVENPAAAALAAAETAEKGDLPTGDASSRDIRAYEENHIFYRWAGMVIQKPQGYYWSPNECESDTGGFVSFSYYRIPDQYEDAVSELFAAGDQ